MVHQSIRRCSRWLPGVLFASLWCVGTLAQAQPPFGPETGDSIRRDLQDRRPDTRIAGLRRAGELGSEGKEYLPHLEDAAASGDPAVRLEAIVAFGRLGKSARAAAPSLIKIIGDKEAALVLKLAAIDAVSRVSPDLEMVRPALEAALEVEPLRVAAARALAAVDPERQDAARLADLLAKALPAEKTAAGRREDGQALSRLGKDGMAALQGLLANDSALVRAEAADALGSIGPKAASAAAPLTALLTDSDAAVRHSAAAALGEVGARSPEVLAGLEKLLAEENPAVRSGAVEALGRLASTGAIPKGLLEKLGEALADPEGDVAARAADALEKAGPAALKTLSAKLESEEARALAAAAIGQIARQKEGRLPELDSIKPQLLKLIRAEAMGKVGAIPDETTRDAVLRTLAVLAPALEGDEKTLEALREAVLDESYPGRAVAALAYAQVAGPKAIPTLRKTVNDSRDPLLRIASAVALLKLDRENLEEAPKLAARLLKSLEDDELSAAVRERVLAALQEAGPKGLPRVDPAMVRTVALRLRDENPAVRVAAIELLADALRRAEGPARGPVAAALRVSRFDPDPTVRAAARKALEANDGRP